MSRKPAPPLTVETIIHDEATRKNIPTAEYQSVMRKDEQDPVRVTYARRAADHPDPLADEKARRNRDLDPQLVWRGKDQQDWSDLVVHAPPLYIQEKIHPKALIDDLRRVTGGEWSVASEEGRSAGHRPLDTGHQFDLFADFNGIPEEADKTEFYRHDQNWSNRMILGDSLQVMASLAEREGLRGKVQCIYIDPPYGIKFNSNFQWSTTSRDVKDGNVAHITREPEQVKAFRDTWRDGIHSYLTYLRDRLTVARDLLTESGSVFVQIGDENVHRVRALMDEIFGDDNCVTLVSFRTTTGLGDQFLDSSCNYIVWYARCRANLKYRELYKPKGLADDVGKRYRRVQVAVFDRRSMTTDEREGATSLPAGSRIFRNDNLTSQSGGESSAFAVSFEGNNYRPGRGYWKTNESGMLRLLRSERVASPTPRSIQYVRFLDDFPVSRFSNVWTDTQTGAFTDEKVYVVQTNTKVIERCILMSTDPGDLVLDPTCGSGTTAYVAEQWGRRWITIDTSRVALALARARIMGARYPYYLLADSPAGQLKEAEISRSAPSLQPTRGDIRHGFVYERVPHITLKSIANNAEIDVIWGKWQKTLEPLREALNAAMGRTWEEWEIPRVAADLWPAGPLRLFNELTGEQAKGANVRTAKIEDALRGINKALGRDYSIETLPERPVDPWPEPAFTLHADWWQARIARQQEIDASIAAKADSESLYDKPYTDKKTVRVSGPFTVESLSPHRVLGVDADDELIDPVDGVGDPDAGYGEKPTFSQMILDNLEVAGVQQAHKADKISFTSLTPWPGDLICAEGRYLEDAQDSGIEKRAAILIGSEFGTVTRPDLVSAAREAGEAGFDVLIACAFNYEAHATELNKLGRIPVLKARMNADLHMAADLKTTNTGNLFVIFGEPDIAILPAEDDRIQIKINGVDVFHPSTGEVRSDGPEGIACWFIDTDYNEESFFVRHAYFLGAEDPYKALKTTLKAEIDEDAWASLNSDTSRPFPKPASGRIAVKVINHLGDEVMKVFRVG